MPRKIKLKNCTFACCVNRRLRKKNRRSARLSDSDDEYLHVEEISEAGDTTCPEVRTGTALEAGTTQIQNGGEPVKKGGTLERVVKFETLKAHGYTLMGRIGSITAYRKTPRKSKSPRPSDLNEVVHEREYDIEVLEELAKSVVDAVIRSALSYTLAAKTVHRNVEIMNDQLPEASDKSSSDYGSDSEGSSISEKEFIALYVDGLLSDVASTLERTTRHECIKEELGKKGIKLITLGVGSKSEEVSESESERTLAAESNTQTSCSGADSEETVIAKPSETSLDWDTYDINVNNPLLAGAQIGEYISTPLLQN